ncbi:MAG: efflux RND transporter permease subunit [Bacteroidales bacterium]|nr:efflux RND transporter permease subunit [Bacteroidales bacterium]MBQ4168227.1 efflux RND transporter permease subunit [Bacteroidales bacterium]MBQ5416037.1 efflux RND transporter permease subunit [Bacteroidales bacterium]
MSIYRTAVRHPVTTALIFMAFLVFGLFSLTRIPIAQLPEFDANVIMVMSSYPGTSASDIEQNLTKTLENSLNGVANLKELTSRSRENISMLTLQFEYGIDIDEATNDVRDKLDMVSSVLPDGASVPTIFKFSADDMPIMIMSATADQSLPGLDKILDDKLVTPLARVSGVGTVSVQGAPSREIQVYCDPNKLQAYGLSVSTLSSIIAMENRNLPSGNIDVGSETFNLRVQKEFGDPSELLDIVVANVGGRAIYLRDVATVVDGQQEREQESYTNGKRSAQIVIQKQSGANTVNVIKNVKKKLADIQKELPSDIEITTVIDSSDNIINTINSLKETILITFIVVMLVVFIFLGRWRATFIIVLSIPIALLASLVYLLATGNSLNIISMSALSIAIGMVVDDAIVVLENVSTHLERGEKPKEAAVLATSEVAISVIASTLTMLCVFIPITMVKGMAGILFKQLGWIVSLIMIVSTTAALTLVPMMCSQMLKAGPKTGKLHNAIFGPINKGLDAISNWYGKIIAWATTHRKATIGIAFGVFLITLITLAPGLKTELFPTSDGGRIQATIELPAGTAQSVTADLAARLYDQISAEIPEIVIMSHTFGSADTDNTFASMQTNGTNVLSLNINVGSMEKRKRSTADISAQLRSIIARFPEVRKANVREGGMSLGGGSSVEIEIYGYDFESTDVVARAIQEQMLQNPMFAQVLLSRDEYTPEYQLDLDRTKLAMNGLNSTTVGNAFSAAMSGSVGSFYREEGEEYSIRVRYAPEFRTSTEDIGNIVVYNAAGRPVRMKELGNVIETRVPPTIERKDRERLITVTGMLNKGYALSEAVALSQQIIDKTEIPGELTAVVAGDYEDQQEMFGDLITLMLLILILVYMVMASQFESFMSPFVIMFSVPFALTGVILGLRLSGAALGIMPMIGIIILLGIVVKNGIVLIDYTILCQERGMSAVEASVTAARSRLRPILMTTLTTVLGMLPMALGLGEGSEMWRPLGLTVCWGLSISTLVTLVLIPSVYCVFATRKEKKKLQKA